MAGKRPVVKNQATLEKRPLMPYEMQMQRRDLTMTVLRSQAEYIRSCIEEEIQEFEHCFGEILQTAQVFLALTEKVDESPSLVIVNQEAVVETVCRFLALSNGILEFLDFQRKRTCLPGGGDVSLEKQIIEAQKLVQKLLQAILLHKKAESFPGKEMGFVHDRDVKVFGGLVFHKNQELDGSDMPDPTRDNVELDTINQYWHAEDIYRPLRHVPGTHWHKFFGNLRPGPANLQPGSLRPSLFREAEPQPLFRIFWPTTILWLKTELFGDYENKRLLFERTRRLPPRLPEHIRTSMIKKIQRGLSCLFKGWKREEDDLILCWEDLGDLPCPEYDILGFSRLESLNAEINAPELAGLSLLGDDIPDVPVLLSGEATKYCLEFDGQWEPEPEDETEFDH